MQNNIYLSHCSINKQYKRLNVTTVENFRNAAREWLFHDTWYSLNLGSCWRRSSWGADWQRHLVAWRIQTLKRTVLCQTRNGSMFTGIKILNMQWLLSGDIFINFTGNITWTENIHTLSVKTKSLYSTWLIFSISNAPMQFWSWNNWDIFLKKVE